MLVEAVVLGRQDRLLHQIGNSVDPDQGASLFTEFTDQLSIGAVNAQRNFRLVVGQRLERGQVRIGHCSGEHHDEHGDTEPARGKKQNCQPPAFEHHRL
jgi:hypothetical protein